MTGPSPLKNMKRDLTEREEEIAGMIADGLSNMAIAAELDISKNTIRIHTKSIYIKLSIKDDERINKRVMLALKIKEKK